MSCGAGVRSEPADTTGRNIYSYRLPIENLAAIARTASGIAVCFQPTSKETAI